MPERHKNVGSHSGQRVKVTGMGAKQVNSKPKEHAHKDACGRGKTSRPESVHPCLGGHSGRACVSWATLTGNDVRDSDKLAKPAFAMMTSEEPRSHFNNDVRDLWERCAHVHHNTPFECYCQIHRDDVRAGRLSQQMESAAHALRAEAHGRSAWSRTLCHAKSLMLCWPLHASTAPLYIPLGPWRHTLLRSFRARMSQMLTYVRSFRLCRMM